MTESEYTPELQDQDEDKMEELPRIDVDPEDESTVIIEPIEDSPEHNDGEKTPDLKVGADQVKPHIHVRVINPDSIYCGRIGELGHRTLMSKKLTVNFPPTHPSHKRGGMGLFDDSELEWVKS